MSYRPEFEGAALVQLNGLPKAAFDALVRTYGSFPVSICGLTCGYMQDSGFWFWLREPGRDG